MQISKEEILHIAKLASLELKEEEIEEYRKNLQDILNFANVISNVDTKNIEKNIAETSNVNVFREDKVKVFDEKELLLQNCKETEKNMFKIPKVI